ncbi:MAG: hypothetical protein FWE13_02700 [Firmicutes bacterium]|nr:hypothetical protein [Bacillota bacterium]
MDNNQLKDLIDSFKGYRDLLAPVQKNLVEFMSTYDDMKDNIDKLQNSFGGEVKKGLEDIFSRMSAGAEKATALASQVDKLASAANNYSSKINSALSALEKIEQRLSAVTDIENRAEKALGQLDEMLAQKSKNYNLKELQVAIDKYNEEVKKVAGFVNNDVGGIILESHENLGKLKGGIDDIIKAKADDKETLQSLLNSFSASEQYLKTITENRDVNEAYMFEILDKWATNRKVKIKK